MRNTILTLFSLLPFLAAGQCGVFYRYHPFGTCTEGWVDISCSTPMDSIVWSTGDVMLTLGSSPALPPGTHTWQVYSSGEVIQTGEVEMEQLEWQIADAHLTWTGGGAMISVAPMCGTRRAQRPEDCFYSGTIRQPGPGSKLTILRTAVAVSGPKSRS